MLDYKYLQFQCNRGNVRNRYPLSIRVIYAPALDITHDKLLDMIVQSLVLLEANPTFKMAAETGPGRGPLLHRSRDLKMTSPPLPVAAAVNI